ncbi:MAG: hypothetical protein HOP28_07755 [Gemmatimonadales bacterium]|nr:hypothetical protein [Gemmatimonadales bacterium]
MSAIPASFALLARRYRTRRRVAEWLAVLGVVLFGFTALAVATALPLAARVIPALLLGSVAAVIIRWRSSREPVDEETIARHLNREFTEAEESAELFLRAASELTLLEQLQRGRVGPRIEPILERLVLPDTWRKRLLLAAGTGLLLTIGLVGGRALGAAPMDAGVRSPGSSVAAATPPKIDRVRIEIVPPAYTRLPVRRAEQLDLDVEEGSKVTWTFSVSGGAAPARLVMTTGDSIPLEPVGQGLLRATVYAAQSTLYQVFFTGAGAPAKATDLHRFVVRLDAPPTVAIDSPATRVEIPSGGALTLTLHATARDDHGVDSTSLVGTVSNGSGEAIRFRSVTLQLVRRNADEGRTGVLESRLDLKRLGMEPGDVLYAHVRVSDSRRPVPNVSISPTVFIGIVDTGRVAIAALTGMALPPLPEALRSQRQLIIDTERLLADSAKISLKSFEDRSANIGLDQGLLRLHYGEYLGDEDYHGEELTGEMPNFPDPSLLPGGPTPPVIPPEHRHDVAEVAVLLSPVTKTKLRKAVAEMWRAELMLRTHKPRASLPFQNRALMLLKEIQQDARLYVQRLAFELPTLEPDKKRFTGELKRMGPLVRTENLSAPGDSSRVALAFGAAVRLADGGLGEAADRRVLEEGGRALAPLALDDPARFLPALRALRETIDSLEAGRRCASCAALAAGGLWRALPLPPAALSAGSRVGRGLADAYARELARRP